MFMNTKTGHTINLMADFGVLWEKPSTFTATHNCLLLLLVLVNSQLNPYVFSEDPSIRICHAPGYNAVFCFGVIPNVQLLTLTRTIHQQPLLLTERLDTHGWWQQAVLKLPWFGDHLVTLLLSFILITGLALNSWSQWHLTLGLNGFVWIF